MLCCKVSCKNYRKQFPKTQKTACNNFVPHGHQRRANHEVHIVNSSTGVLEVESAYFTVCTSRFSPSLIHGLCTIFAFNSQFKLCAFFRTLLTDVSTASFFWGVRKRVVSKRVVLADAHPYQTERRYIRMFPVPKTERRYIRMFPGTKNRSKPPFCFHSILCQPLSSRFALLGLRSFEMVSPTPFFESLIQLSSAFGCSATLGITMVQIEMLGAKFARDGHPPQCSLKPQEQEHKMDSRSSQRCPLFLRPKSKPAGREKPIRVAAIRVVTKYSNHSQHAQVLDDPIDAMSCKHQHCPGRQQDALSIKSGATAEGSFPCCGCAH